MSDLPESTDDPVADALALVVRNIDALRAENERLRETLEEIIEASEMHTQFLVSLEKEETGYTAFQGGVCHGRELAAHIARKALEGGGE